jgi:4a-hydroxytetrahydrobiopterin dehydratase
MPAAALLSDDEIAARLRALPAWRQTGNAIARTFVTADFRSALDLVNAVAGPADEQNHHPDVSIHWNEVTFTLWTHASGGLTERDFRLARAIDEIAERT